MGLGEQQVREEEIETELIENVSQENNKH
jgi:hypothetical protein